MSMDDPADAVEWAELEIGASGPMPFDARKHLADLVNNVHQRKRRRSGNRRPKLKLVRREDVDDIADPVVRSGLAMAEEDIEAFDAEYAKREEELQAAPPVPDAERAARLAALAARVVEVVHDARADGVRFKAIDHDAVP